MVLYKLSNFTHEIEQNPIKPTMSLTYTDSLNSLRPRRNGRYNADDIFKCIFLKENVWIPTKISLKFVLKGPINNIPALAQIMAWRRPGDKPLSEPMMVSLLKHIRVTRPQWFNIHSAYDGHLQKGKCKQRSICDLLQRYQYIISVFCENLC